MVSVLLYVKRGRHIGLKSITEGEGVNKLPKVRYRIDVSPLPLSHGALSHKTSIHANPSNFKVSECLFFTDRISHESVFQISPCDRAYLKAASVSIHLKIQQVVF